MTTLYVLDTPENAAVVAVGACGPDVEVDRVGPYYQLSSPGTIVIDRRATGSRHAVWYSCVAGVGQARITQWDKNAMRIEPA